MTTLKIKKSATAGWEPMTSPKYPLYQAECMDHNVAVQTFDYEQMLQWADNSSTFCDRCARIRGAVLATADDPWLTLGVGKWREAPPKVDLPEEDFEEPTQWAENINPFTNGSEEKPKTKWAEVRAARAAAEAARTEADAARTAERAKREPPFPNPIPKIFFFYELFEPEALTTESMEEQLHHEGSPIEKEER